MYISRVSNQNDESLPLQKAEIHHSGQKPLIYYIIKKPLIYYIIKREYRYSYCVVMFGFSVRFTLGEFQTVTIIW